MDNSTGIAIANALVDVVQTLQRIEKTLRDMNENGIVVFTEPRGHKKKVS
jgi:hypothetical protein